VLLIRQTSGFLWQQNTKSVTLSTGSACDNILWTRWRKILSGNSKITKYVQDIENEQDICNTEMNGNQRAGKVVLRWLTLMKSLTSSERVYWISHQKLKLRLYDTTEIQLFSGTLVAALPPPLASRDPFSFYYYYYYYYVARGGNIWQKYWDEVCMTYRHHTSDRDQDHTLELPWNTDTASCCTEPYSGSQETCSDLQRPLSTCHYHWPEIRTTRSYALQNKNTVPNVNYCLLYHNAASCSPK